MPTFRWPGVLTLALVGLGCAQSLPAVPSVNVPVQAADRHLMAFDPTSVTRPDLPAHISVADAPRLLVRLDHIQLVAPQATYSVMAMGSRGGESRSSGTSRSESRGNNENRGSGENHAFNDNRGNNENRGGNEGRDRGFGRRDRGFGNDFLFGGFPYGLGGLAGLDLASSLYYPYGSSYYPYTYLNGAYSPYTYPGLAGSTYSPFLGRTGAGYTPYAWQTAGAYGMPTQPTTGASQSVVLQQSGFQPSVIQVPVGGTVQFTNLDPTVDAVVPETQGITAQALWTGQLSPGQTSQLITLNEPGQFTFHSMSNPAIRGTIIVQ